jgi:hypothetical protein
MKIIITGSRNFDNYDLLEYTLDVLPIDFIVVGDARGADKLARDYAKEKHLDCQVYSANWDTEGRAAGPLRNQRMLDAHPDAEMVIAFPTESSVGTWDMVLGTWYTRLRKQGLRQ